MIPYWFGQALPPSRHTIESAVRLSLWGGGFGGVFVTCIQDTVPYRCECLWHDQPFTMEWVPMDYLELRLKTPNHELVTAFENVLNHKAFASYRDEDKEIVIEWRVQALKGRWDELEARGVRELERLS